MNTSTDTDTDTEKASHPKRERSRVISLPNAPEPGSLAWRQARGLLTISDHARNYSGTYSIPMVDDLLGPRSE